jgi:hypothetical protein
MLDARGRDTRVFEVGHPLRVVLEIEADEELHRPIFVFCAYLPDGRCATQWVASAHELGRESVAGRARVVFEVGKLLMGRGAYVASAAIFKYIGQGGVEPEAYFVMDRCIHFQIVQPPGDNLELGLCLQPFEARIEQA